MELVDDDIHILNMVENQIDQHGVVKVGKLSVNKKDDQTYIKLHVYNCLIQYVLDNKLDKSQTSKHKHVIEARVLTT